MVVNYHRRGAYAVIDAGCVYPKKTDSMADYHPACDLFHISDQRRAVVLVVKIAKRRGGD